MNFISIFFLLWFLIIYSNYFNLRFKIKFNESFFLSICILILFSFLLSKLEYNLTNFLFEYILIFFCIISVVFIPNLLTNINKINLKLNFEFIVLFIIIFLLTKDRYYLDQDEFAYWGMALKAFSLAEPFRSLEGFDHHPQGLNVFRYVLSSPKFNEGMAIFSNNVILISGFYFLFYGRRLIFLEKLLLFVIYYLLLNNLSFGFISIYADPILAIFYACLLKKLFYFFKKSENKIGYSFFLILGTLLLIKRSSIIYGVYTLLIFSGLFLIDRYKLNKKHFYLYSLLLILLSLITYKICLPLILEFFELQSVYETNILLYSDIINQKFFNFLLTPIYFSQFGATLNGILETISMSSFKVMETQIPILFYIILLFFFLFFKFKFKPYLFTFSLILIIVHMIIILVFKSYFVNLHLSALPRYIGIILISKFLFFISLVIDNYKSIHKNYILLFFLSCFLIITPKKSLGFFVTDNIYYKDISNKNYNENRRKISQLNRLKDNYKDIIVVHKEGFSDFTNEYVSGNHTFYQNIIRYELFPQQPIFIEYNDYIINKLHHKFNQHLIVLFDLPLVQNNEIFKNKNIFVINTYKK